MWTHVTSQYFSMAALAAKSDRLVKVQKCAPHICIHISGQQHIEIVLRASLLAYIWNDGDTHQVMCVVCNKEFHQDTDASGCSFSACAGSFCVSNICHVRRCARLLCVIGSPPPPPRILHWLSFSCRLPRSPRH